MDIELYDEVCVSQLSMNVTAAWSYERHDDDGDERLGVLAGFDTVIPLVIKQIAVAE